MSSAFVKEGDGESSEQLPERPISAIPNYVTHSGLALLRAEVERLGEARRVVAKDRNDPTKVRKLKEVERDLRYYETRLETAKLVDHSDKRNDEIRFGSTVDVAGDAAKTYRIVGEDEADPEKGLLCWASPLADTLLGSKVGEKIVWKKRSGDELLLVTAVRYDSSN